MSIARNTAGKFEAWAADNIVLPDGPLKGKRFKPQRAPWREIFKAVTSP